MSTAVRRRERLRQNRALTDRGRADDRPLMPTVTSTITVPLEKARGGYGGVTVVNGTATSSVPGWTSLSVATPDRRCVQVGGRKTQHHHDGPDRPGHDRAQDLQAGFPNACSAVKPPGTTA